MLHQIPQHDRATNAKHQLNITGSTNSQADVRRGLAALLPHSWSEPVTASMPNACQWARATLKGASAPGAPPGWPPQTPPRACCTRHTAAAGGQRAPSPGAGRPGRGVRARPGRRLCACAAGSRAPGPPAQWCGGSGRPGAGPAPRGCRGRPRLSAGRASQTALKHAHDRRRHASRARPQT